VNNEIKVQAFVVNHFAMYEATFEYYDCSAHELHDLWGLKAGQICDLFETTTLQVPIIVILRFEQYCSVTVHQEGSNHRSYCLHRLHLENTRVGSTLGK
jgi:hypothetical protein